jgi:hypothetical protein
MFTGINARPYIREKISVGTVQMRLMNRVKEMIVRPKQRIESKADASEIGT